jgi:hypothetical protein
MNHTLLLHHRMVQLMLQHLRLRHHMQKATMLLLRLAQRL